MFAFIFLKIQIRDPVSLIHFEAEGRVLTKAYLQKEVAGLWIIICQPLDEITGETKVLFGFWFGVFFFN